MADVLDVAEQILQTKGPTDTYSLQKLVYYSYACHLARTHEPLFDSRIEAWINGPAVPALYREHKGNYKVSTVKGNPGNLDANELESVKTALRFYGDHDSTWLVMQTHMESPWIDARQDLGPKDRGSNQITDEALLAYFEGIFNDPEILGALNDAEEDPGLTIEELYARYAK